MSKLEGTIALTGLPPHRGLILNVCFFPVAGPEAPVPYGGDPPAEAVTDCQKVFQEVDLDKESQQSAVEHAFVVEHEPGYCYLQVRAILFRKDKDQVFAQAEQFFFARRPVNLGATAGSLTLPIAWPTAPLDALHHHGTIKPQQKG